SKPSTTCCASAGHYFMARCFRKAERSPPAKKSLHKDEAVFARTQLPLVVPDLVDVRRVGEMNLTLEPELAGLAHQLHVGENGIFNKMVVRRIGGEAAPPFAFESGVDIHLAVSLWR